MFDPATAALVRSARALPGLNPDALVEQLTSAYVDIAAARLALDIAADQPGPDLGGLLSRMRRLADTYESYITLDLFPEQSRSAAFVAGAARQVTARIAELGAVSDERPSRLDEDAIGGEIAAALLFLIAEQPSDALEAARGIQASGGEIAPIRRALTLAIRFFCQGAFRQVVEINPESEGLGVDDPQQYAADLLFRELLRGIRLLALAGLGEAGDAAIADAQQRFDRVRRLAVDSALIEGRDGTRVEAVSLYAGPHHLAALLGRSSRTLVEAALVRTPVPGGADAAMWDGWLRAEAGRWPFLWPNHRACLKTGYLNKGQSLVMTTPTGSGKTTLATLKIAATIAGGRTVLYLAPTHALVGQIERDLNARIAGIARAGSIEDISLTDEIETLPDLAVATPERCFALLTFAPHLFVNVGLLVFDEFHLLGVSKPKTDVSPARIGRRGIDAMLCLLTFLSIQRDADVLLLSAMVDNGDQVALWLQSILNGRPVRIFNDRWKPTRQLRACLTYDKNELIELRSAIVNAGSHGLPLPPLNAMPLGLFSLVSGWNPASPDKLALRVISTGPVPLRKGSGQWLTSNRGVVAAQIARGFAAAGLKIIVFCESIRMCVSVAAALNEGPGGAVEPTLNGPLSALRDSLIEELGVVTAVYDAGARRAAVHHGELLQGERELVETLFRDTGSGVNVLVATSTLAQGLNLPCEVVILAGTDRLSEDEDEVRTPLMAHEILNALGRAGRAGHASTGLAIVIPATPLGCNTATKIPLSDVDVRIVFAESDQCLPLEDPLAVLFDRIEVDGAAGEEAQYLLRRLSVSFGEGRLGVEGFDSLAGRTFGFWRRSQIDPASAQVWLTQRRTTLEACIAELSPVSQLPWQEELAAKTGASADFIAKLSSEYASAPVNATEATHWIGWLLDQLDPISPDFDVFLRPESLGRVFGRSYNALIAVPGGRATIRDGLKTVVLSWLSGRSLTEMEAEICVFVAAHEGTVKRPTRPDGRAKRARRFALRLAPDLSFLCGVLAQVAGHHADEPDGLPAAPMVTFMPSLLRHGCRTPYHYMIRRTMETPSRPAVELRFESIEADLDRQPSDTWDQVRSKVEQALALEMFDVLPESLED